MPDSMELLQHQMPPEYDQEIIENIYPPDESVIDDHERAVDFSRDRNPAEREEIATRCGAD